MSSDRKWTDENVFDQHCNLWCNTGAALANLLYCGFNEEPTLYKNKADYRQSFFFTTEKKKQERFHFPLHGNFNLVSSCSDRLTFQAL